MKTNKQKQDEKHVFTPECETNDCKICKRRRKAEIKLERDAKRAKNIAECKEVDWDDIDRY